MFEKDDVPLRVAWGFALGSCVNFYPTLGFGFPVAAIVAYVSRTNVAAALIGETILKPLFPFMFYLDIEMGHLLFGVPPRPWDIHTFKMHAFITKLIPVYAKSFFIGALANTLIFASVVGGCLYVLLTKYRERIRKLLLTRKEDTC